MLDLLLGGAQRITDISGSSLPCGCPSMASPLLPSLSPALRHPVFLETPRSLPFSLPIRRLSLRRTLCPPSIKAVKEWAEYEDAVREKDLARALRFLKSMEAFPTQSSSLSPSPPPPSMDSVASSIPSDLYNRELLRPERDWEVLDTCLNADDMRLVGSAYSFLQARGLLPSFGKFRNISMVAAFSFLFFFSSSFFLEIGIDLMGI